MRYRFRAQDGVALPVMLIILVVMLISSIYLLKASHSNALTASNLAYDAAQARAVDLGLHQGYLWLRQTANANKAALDVTSSANGYQAIYTPGQSVRADAFWQNARNATVPTGMPAVQYVIHRLCSLPGAYNAANNRCTRTAENPLAMGSDVKLGESMGSDTPRFTAMPRVHYVITARVTGPRGGNVVNQMVVQIGA